MKSRLVLIAATALATSSAMALPSRAGLAEQSLTRTETVKYKASQAETAEGAASLYAQLQNAAVRVCSSDALDAVGDSAGYQACVADALDAAVRRVSIPMVSVLHLQAGKPAAVAAR